MVAGILYGLIRGKKDEEAIWFGMHLSDTIGQKEITSLSHEDWERIKRRIFLEESMVHIEKRDYLGNGASRLDQYLSP